MTSPVNPFRPEGSKKLVYCARNLKVVPAKEIWPNAEGTENVFVLTGEHYVHDEWFPLRSSRIEVITGNDVETRNSIYRDTNDSLSPISKIEMLYEQTYEKDGGHNIPSYEGLIELFEAVECFQQVRGDDRLVNMLTDVENKDDQYDTDYSLRLLYRSPLRRVLELFRECGVEVKSDLAFGRA